MRGSDGMQEALFTFSKLEDFGLNPLSWTVCFLNGLSLSGR